VADKSGRSKDREIRLSEAQLRHPGMEESFSRRAEPSADTEGLEQEYSYVLADLRRIGLIAMAMLAVLLALALFVF